MLAGSLRPRPLAMSTRSRLPLTKDEELGKRDDDFKPRLHRSSSMTSVLPWNWRKRRTLGLLGLVALLYLLLRYIPSGFDITVGPSYAEDPFAAVAYSEPVGAPPRPAAAELDVTLNHYYEGPIRFYKLARSLHGIASTMGTMHMNRNILFAASSIKSAANLMPMVCEMAKIDRNHAHLALFGRSTLPLHEVLKLNGVDEDECTAHFHDARGDFPEYSSNARLESATKGAMKHINDYMHPQAIIMDDSTKEDLPFTRAMRASAKALGLDKALIEVPAGCYEDWLWLTRLEALSLSTFHKPSIEILIHAPVGSAGGLIRLLQSLYNADYRGLKVPRLTIELPSVIDHFLENYLSGFRWPPGRDDRQPDLLTLRHRIPTSRVGSEEASVRFIESYYPSDKGNNHVLVLSPNVEVDPLYLQYLYYTILEYHAITLGWYAAQDMIGISLDVPARLVDGNTSLAVPPLANLTRPPYAKEKPFNPEEPAPFLYQGASSAATLVFGERWATFHDFLTKRLQASHSGKKGKTSKVVAETEPAWVEFLLELMRARGWTILHPPTSFVTVHNDLAQIPEEFVRPPKEDKAPPESTDKLEQEPFILSADIPVLTERVEIDTAKSHMPLHHSLPFEGELQSISDLPILTHEGKSILSFDLSSEAQEYTTWFRASIGGCQGDQASRARVRKDEKTDDLFCLPGIDIAYEDEELELDWAAEVAQAIADSTDDALEFPATSSDPTTKPTKQPSTAETSKESDLEDEDDAT